MADEEPEKTRPLLLDELAGTFERFRLLRKSDEAATDALLDDLGAHSNVDRDMVLELSATEPLGQPERFVEAHCLAMRSIEVLDRNGARPVKITAPFGPLRPVAATLVQLVCRFIVRNHQADVADAVADLYDRRLAWTPYGHPSRLDLTRASREAHRVALGYKRNPIGIPTFLLGGAVVSALGSAFQAIGDAAFGTTAGRIIAVSVVFVLLGVVGWVFVRGAAAARRRIKLTVEQPVAALWETVGRCGNPPDDRARQFVVLAVTLTLLGWLVIPAGVLFVMSNV
jgi:hypothetical protein